MEVWGDALDFKAYLNYDLASSLIFLFKLSLMQTHIRAHTHQQCVRGVWRGGGGGTTDKGVLACGKGNHGAGAWVARVRVSAHTVWMWSSFLLLRMLRMNHKLLMPRSLQTYHSLLRCRSFPKRHRNSQMKSRSFPMRCRSSLKCHMFQGERRLPMRCTSGVPSTSQGVQGLWWKLAPAWWPVEEGVVVEDWCRHTGGTGIVAGTADTVGIDAFAGSTLCKT